MKTSARFRYVFFFGLAILLTLTAFAQTNNQPSAEKKPFIIESADEGKFTDNTVELSGNVVIRWGDYRLTADLIKGDTLTQQYNFTGNIKISGGGVTAEGENLFIDFKSKTWRLDKGNSAISPDFLDNMTIADLFAQGELVEGHAEAVFIKNAAATTCRIKEPHYYIASNDVEVDAVRKIIFRNNDVYINKRRIAHIPTIVVPLQTNRQRDVLPDVGYNDFEGAFLKAALGYTVGRNAYGNIKADIMEKKGFGFGFDQQYQSAKNSGNFGAYVVTQTTNSNTDFNGYLSLLQAIGSANIKLKSDFRSYDYASYPDNQQWSSNLLIALPQKQASTRLTARYLDNQTSFFSNKSFSINLTDSRRINKQFRWEADLGYNDVKSRSLFYDTRRASLENRVAFHYDQKLLSVELLIDELTPIGDGKNYYGGLEKLPEVIIRTTGERLFKTNRRFLSNLSAQLGYGRYIEQNGDTDRQRIFFEAATQKSEPDKAGLSLSYNISFTQSVYDDDSAQYIVRAGISPRWGFDKKSGLALRYSYIHPQGYTPFNFDRTSKLHLASALLETKLFRTLSIQAESGYDFLADEYNYESWQNTSANVVWMPSKDFRLRTAFTYDFNQDLFTNVRGDASLKFKNTVLKLAGRYDVDKKIISKADVLIDTLKLGKASISAILSWDGYLESFTTQQYLLTYDLHCAEAVFRYSDNPFGHNRNQSFMFYIRIKAFPFLNMFGIGSQGEATGFSSPADY